MNDQYSDAFKSIVPDAPSSGGWADGARRKRRHRRRVVAGLATAAAIAVVVPLSLTLDGKATLIATPDKSESPSPQAEKPSPDPAVDGPGAAACWDAQGQPRASTKEGAEDGAMRAWLCGDAGIPVTSLDWEGPLEPLVEGVDEIVDFISIQPPLGDDVACTAEYVLAYRIVLDYGDGSQHVVPGALHGCGTITDGDTSRLGGPALYDLARDLWRQQRDTMTPAADVPAVVDCLPGPPGPATRPILPLDPARATRGFLCTEAHAGGNTWGMGGLLDTALVDSIAEGIATASPEPSDAEPVASWLTLFGTWGEQLTLQRTPEDAFQWVDDGTRMVWKPSADVLEQLERVELTGEGPITEVGQVDAIDECLQYTRLPSVATAEVDDLVGGHYCHRSTDNEFSATLGEIEVDTIQQHLVAESVLAVGADVAEPFGHLRLVDATDRSFSIIEDVEGRLWWRRMDGQLMQWQPGATAKAELDFVIAQPRQMNSDFYADLLVCGPGGDGPSLSIEEAESVHICDPTGTTVEEAEILVPDSLAGLLIDQVATAGAGGSPDASVHLTGWSVVLSGADSAHLRLVQWSDGSLTGQGADGAVVMWRPFGAVLDGLRDLGMGHLQG